MIDDDEDENSIFSVHWIAFIDFIEAPRNSIIPANPTYDFRRAIEMTGSIDELCVDYILSRSWRSREQSTKRRVPRRRTLRVMLLIELHVRVHTGRNERSAVGRREASFFFAPPVIITGALSLLPRHGPQWGISLVRRPVRRFVRRGRVASTDLKRGGYLKAFASLTQRTSKGSAEEVDEEKHVRLKTEKTKASYEPVCSSDSRHEIVSAGARERLNLQRANTCE